MYRQFNYQSKLVLFSVLVFLLFPLSLFAHPSGMMHGDMDDDDMQRYMQQRGMNPGYWGNQMGQMMGPGMMGPMSGMMMGQLSNLELDQKQRNEVRKLMQSMRKEHWSVMEKMMETSDKLVDLYGKDTPDPEKIGKVYEQVYKLKIEMIKQHITLRNKISGLLNKEQKEKFKQNDFFGMHFGMGMMF